MNPQTLAKTLEPTTTADLPDWAAHGDRPHIPNAETIAAIERSQEYFRKLENGEIQPRFANVADFFASLLDFDSEEEKNADTGV